MSETSIYKALDDRLLAYQATNVDWIGNAYKPVEGTPWLRPRMTAITSRRVGNGPKGVVRWNGLYQVSCFHPILSGTAAATDKAAAIRALFPQALSLVTTDSRIINFDAPMAGPVLLDPPAKPMWAMAITIAVWWSDEYPA